MNLSELIVEGIRNDPLCSQRTALSADELAGVRRKRETARSSLFNIAKGVSAIGTLMGLAGNEGEVSPSTAAEIGWFLEEMGDVLASLSEVVGATTDRLHAHQDAMVSARGEVL
ncbi:hypothetical protein GO594_22365 [Pseudomonas otitidis]|uniref:Uncharacterized protein n=1 Tax=Metapseudomonas otitidis TaxID=319939 RepID=A0A7X3HB52_9GAMM|nr:hypothetical protein [Pseudomonas otitidis]MWK58736.1 hypothetical protein [Pseudomonas otitidis]